MEVALIFFTANEYRMEFQFQSTCCSEVCLSSSNPDNVNIKITALELQLGFFFLFGKR